MTRNQFVALVEGEQKQLRRFLLALCCGNAQEADDLAQEALVKAYLASDKFADTEHFAAWLYRIAHNTFIDSRRMRREQTSIDRAAQLPDTSVAADGSYQYQDLYVALAQLPEKERTAVLLFYLRSYAVREIAEITNCSESAVKKQLERGRNELRKTLKR